MKKSRITLLGGAGFIFLILLSLMILLRVKVDDFLSSSADPQSTVEASGIFETREFNFKDFDELYFENVWDIRVVAGSNFNIQVEADKAILDEIQIIEEGSGLKFTYDKYIRESTKSGNHMRAIITMPDVEKIVFSGMGELMIRDFDLDRLEVINSGASNIDAENLTIDELSLVVNGAANAELLNVDIYSCDLNISGAANIELNMTGGELTGSISGAASVIYQGSVSNESVSISGIGSLDRR